VANVGADRATQAGFDESIGNLTTAVALRSIGLTNRKTISFGVLDDPRFDD
jgi:hypothetical protein